MAGLLRQETEDDRARAHNHASYQLRLYMAVRHEDGRIKRRTVQYLTLIMLVVLFGGPYLVRELVSYGPTTDK